MMQNTLYPFQFGFRKNYSSTDTFIYLVNLKSESVDKGKRAGIIFLNLKIELDVVDYDI